MENKHPKDQLGANPEPLLNAAQVSYRLHLSRSCTYNLMQSGAIPTVCIGKARRVRWQDLEAFILRNIHSTEKDF